MLFAILQKYDFSSKSQHVPDGSVDKYVVCDTAKVRFFKQITTALLVQLYLCVLFAILQKYDFSSKSQLPRIYSISLTRCLWYCKSTIFQANHNDFNGDFNNDYAVCDTAKVRFFKQITTSFYENTILAELFAILQKYDFSSKSQLSITMRAGKTCCLRYCKSTIFQANHNLSCTSMFALVLFAILQKYDFSSKSQLLLYSR
mgnify:CR=1 FL=1